MSGMKGLLCVAASSTEQEVVLVDWNGPEDPENPYNWPQRKKVMVTAIALFATFVSMLNGSILTVAHNAINSEFKVSDEEFPHSYWPVTSWGVGGALSSLVLLPIMEDFGVRYVFLMNYFVFICLLIPIGLASNFATLVATRFFSGGCVAILGNTVAGVVSNIYEGDRGRTVPISLYITTYLVSSSMGPVVGSSIFQFLDWHWIGWIELIWTGVFFPIFILATPESRGSAILKQRAQKMRKDGVKAYTAAELDTTPPLQQIMKSIQRPLYMLCTEPVVFVATVWAAFSLGVIYVFQQSAEQVFQELYGFDAVQGGYLQATMIIGELLGLVLCIFTNRWYYASASRNTEVPGVPIPEARLYAAVIGGFLGVTGGMFVYAWTSYSFIHWIAPAIGIAMVGIGSTAVATSIVNYLIDAYSKYAGSAVGAVGVGENIFIAFLPLATTAMYTNLGFQWASSLLGFLSLILAITPIVVFIWGRQIRERSPFMKEAVAEKRAR